MISSMTGYGEAEGQLDGVTYAVEIKTVNNRYFKTSVKLPEIAAWLEQDIEKLLRENIARGTVNYTLRLKNGRENALYEIVEPVLRGYIQRLSHIASASDIACTIDIGGLLNLPGVFQPKSPDEQTAGKIKQVVLDVTQAAIEKLKQMRAVEGAVLEADLKKHCHAIEQDLEQINARSAAVLREYAGRLRKRVDELLAEAKLKLDEEILAREVAVFADRSDISEEVARLDSHLQQLFQTCQGAPLPGVSENGPPQANDQAGRRLDFISQEMLREANTIASKACDTEISRYVVDIKCRIDRIKEQVQNIE